MSMKYIEEMSRKGVSYKKFNSAFGAKILEKFGWKEGEGLGKSKNGITEAIQIKRREENMGLGKTKKEVMWNDKWWEQSYNNILKDIKPKNSDKKEINKERKNSEDKSNKKRKNSNVSNVRKERKDSIDSLNNKKRKNSNVSNGKKERKDSINSVIKKERKNSNISNYNKRSRKNSKDNINENKNKMLKKKRKITLIDI